MTTFMIDNYVKTCMKAWMYCEVCLHAEKENNNPKWTLINECLDCAQSCSTLVSQLISQPHDIYEYASSCLFHCRQCLAECEKYSGGEEVRNCAEACYCCSEFLKNLVFSFHLN